MVGIGASAGGFEAFSQMLAGLPAHLDAAFVFVQHLDPTHESVLDDLLAKTTPIPVRQAAESMPVQAGTIYVIAPDTQLSLHDNQLVVVKRPKGGPHLPIDLFFRSLAQARGSLAVGIVLSGSGSDGALGLKTITTDRYWLDTGVFRSVV